MTQTPSLAAVVAALDAAYDPAWADDWDAVGTVCGHPDAPVSKVLFAVDPVATVVDEAIEWGADLLVTHHPLLLRAVHGVAAAAPKGRVVHDLIGHGIGLHTCHTNADSPAGGVSESLALALGLDDLRPIDPDPVEPLDKVVTFVPHAAVEAVVDALVAAGAGAIGDYDRCTFTSTGVGTFRPREGANPAIGEVGRVERVDETRLEMVAARPLRSQVVAALRSAHPYEEPAFDLLAMADRPGDRGSGRIGRLAQRLSLADFASRVVTALPATSSVARVAGDPDGQVATVAVCGGAGDFLLEPVRHSGVDVYVTSDLRHHPALEFREYAGPDPSSPALIDVPHWAAEWTWLPRAAERLRQDLAGSGATVEIRVSRLVTDPWTTHLPMRGLAR
ncbi:MAG: YqfO family protein [Nocardioidaceae bacterium]